MSRGVAQSLARRWCTPLAVVVLAQNSLVAQTTERVSVDSTGGQGDYASFYSAISADARFVAFTSGTTNLVPGDTNSDLDVFVHDLLTGATERVSVNTSGAQGDADSEWPAISADGRFVAFESKAVTLGGPDLNGQLPDIYLRDRSSSTTEPVSINSAGVMGNSASYRPSISADGRFIAFYSHAYNLVPGDTNVTVDVFVRDRLNWTTERVSIASSGAEANARSDSPSISGDGRFVAFLSSASNLVAGDTNAVDDVFVRDRLNGTTERASVGIAGAQANERSWRPSISGDGRFVVFTCRATNLVAADTNGCDDTFVRDRVTANNELISISSAEAQGDFGGYYGSISPDGRFVVFLSDSTNLVTGDTNGQIDVFVRDAQAGTTERVSVASDGTEAFARSDWPSIAVGGRYVAFESYASNLVLGDTNGVNDVFVRDRVGLPISYCTSGTSSNGCAATITASAHPSMSFANPCTLAVANVDGHRSGILFYSASNIGFTPHPWAPSSTSWLCVKSPTQRTPLQDSGGGAGACNGSYVLDWNAFQLWNPLALGNPWSAGNRVFAQAWFRDPPAAKTTNLSNAVEMTYVP